MRSGGGRGRIRTSVARKERQIYSLLVLATHPPVRTGELQGRRPLCSSEKKRHNSPVLQCRNPPPKNKRESSPDSNFIWQSWRRDLNPRPSDYKSDALPTELRQHGSNRGNITKGQENCKGLYGRVWVISRRLPLYVAPVGIYRSSSTH